jgi:hypothetical protein
MIVTWKKSRKSLPRVISCATMSMLFTLTRSDTAALLTISSDKTNSGSGLGCLQKIKQYKETKKKGH